MPRRDEEVLKAVPQTMETLIEECVKGLPTLGHVIRRWLRSAKASEPDVRPLARLQNEESQKRYAGYMTRFLCYTLRVWKSCEEVGAETVPSGGEEEESEDEDVLRSSPRQASQESGVIVVDTMKDARRLYPWQSGLREIVARLWRALSPSGGLESPQHVILEFFRHVLFQHIRVNVFESPLIHFLAVLGIDEDTCRLREGNDFSYMLAGLVYCSRVLGVEIILPKMLRKTETQEDDDRFLSLRLKHLADGSFSPMAEMISLLAYSRHCAFNHANAGAISWSPDDSVIAYRGQKIPLARFKRLIDTVITEAENILWRELLWQTDSSRFELMVDQLEDDVTFTRRGFSFLDHTRNGLKDTRAWVLAQMEAHGEGRKLRQGERWHRRRVRKYLRRVDHFRELLLLCVHWTGGQPARGTEITSIRFRNGYMQDRNVFAIHGHLAVVTRYHKSASQFDQPKVVPRFLAWRVGQLLAVYLAYAQPLGELLADAVNGQVAGEYVWAGEHGPWETDRLTRVIKRETGRHLGIELTTHSYRHVAIAIGRKVIGEQFANGYRGEVDGVEDEPEEETEDSLEMQAGRGGEVGAKRYGVSMDIIKNLSSRSIDTFRPLCQQWHRFLGLESSKAGGGAAIRVAPHGIKRKWDMDMDAAGADVLGALKRLKHCSGRGESQAVGRGDSQPQARAERSGDENPFIAAMRKALRKDEVSFRSEAQKEALTAIVKGGRSPLVVVIPTGGGKSLLFTAPACLVDAGMTIVVVPFRALINDLVDKAKEAGIDSIEWRPGEVNPATLVFVSADLVDGTGFLGYAQQLLDSGWLRRIFVDECHLIFKDGHWRSKLARLGTLRRVNCEMILLTATLPPIMQGELEYCMAMEMCRYIRADTTRLRTRYMVEECKAGALESRAVDICRSWAQAHPSAKGVVYCRGRKQCERLAAELGGVFYHSEADGKEERIEHWLKYGGLIVATSALGTGVDFPGITLVLHVDVPWSMIDFAQESGRAGRQGEDADSVIVYEEGQPERIRHKMQSADERAMLDFISTRSCRRRVQSRFLDGIERDCVSDERGLAYCDGCGEGWTALERRQRQDCEKRAVVERVLSELVDDCPVGFRVRSDGRRSRTNTDGGKRISAGRGRCTSPSGLTSYSRPTRTAALRVCSVRSSAGQVNRRRRNVNGRE
jgi:superfamily II DNA or RNA helicase